MVRISNKEQLRLAFVAWCAIRGHKYVSSYKDSVVVSAEFSLLNGELGQIWLDSETGGQFEFKAWNPSRPKVRASSTVTPVTITEEHLYDALDVLIQSVSVS